MNGLLFFIPVLLSQTLFAADFQALEEYAFPLAQEKEDNSRSGIRTNAVLAIKDGKVAYERYSRGYNATRKHKIWSIGKSFLNALTAIAVKENKLRLEDSICNYGFKTKCSIKIIDLLHWRSCLTWQETYERNPEGSDVIKVLYGLASLDSVNYVLSRPLECTPGDRFHYSTGDSLLLAGVLKNIYGPEYNDMPWNKLFNKIGIKHITVEQDVRGVHQFAANVLTTARDVAQFGMLYLNDGKVGNESLFPESWMENMMKPVGELNQYKDKENIPLAHFWGNQNKRLSKVPENTFYAQGHWDQYLVVIPSLKVVIVRFGDTRDDSFSLDTFVSLVLEGLK